MSRLRSKLKYVFSLLLLFGLFSGISPMQAEAKTPLPNWKWTNVIDTRTVIQSKYSFIPIFKHDTTISWGGGTGNGYGGWKRTDLDAYDRTKFRTFDAINNPGRKGSAYFKYSKVGNYNGKDVDLKIVLKDWKLAKYHSNGGNISFQEDTIGLSTQGFDWVDMDWQFYESGTNNRIYVNGYLTMSDIDLFQGIDLHSSAYGKTHRYYVDSVNNQLWYERLSSEWHRISSNYGGDVPDDTYNPNYAFTFTFSGDSLRFRWMSDWSMISHRVDIMGQFKGPRYTNRNRAIGEYFMYSDIKPAPFGSPMITKSVNRSNLRHPHTTNKDITYNLNMYLPSESNRTFHKSMVVTDSIDPALDIESVRVYSGNSNVTNDFNISTSGNKVKASAKSHRLSNMNFYNKNYRVEIRTRPNMRYLDAKFRDSSIGDYNVWNRASVATDRDVETSKWVNTTIEAPVYYDLSITHRDESTGQIIEKESFEFLELEEFTAYAKGNLNTRNTRPGKVYNYKPLNPQSITVEMTDNLHIEFYYRVPKLEIANKGIDIYTDTSSGSRSEQPVDVYIDSSIQDHGSYRGPRDSVHDFVGGKVRLNIRDLSNNKSVWSDVKSVVGMKDKYSFNIPNDYIGKGKQTKYVYDVEVVNNGNNNYELVTKSPSIETLGHTSSEIDIVRSNKYLDGNGDFRYSDVILTEARQGKNLVEHEEHVLVHKIKQPRLKSGYGYEFTPHVEYSVDSKSVFDRVQGRVPSKIETKPQIRIDEEVVDLSDPYINGDNVVIKLDKDTEYDSRNSHTKDQSYFLPKAYLSKRDGRIRYDDKKDNALYLGNNSSNIDTSQHVFAGRKMYVPIWIESLGNYNATLEHTQRIGSNKVGLSIDNVIDVYAFMFSHIDSITPEEYQDELLLHPMDQDDELFDMFR